MMRVVPAASCVTAWVVATVVSCSGSNGTAGSTGDGGSQDCIGVDTGTQDTTSSCGSQNSPCCNGTACNSGLVCTGRVCLPSCGGSGEACCNGTACNAGLACSAGICTGMLMLDGGADSGGDATGGSDASDAASERDSSAGEGGAACPVVDAGAVTAGYPAAHSGMLPQLTYQGGGILTSPELVTVTFPADALASSLEQFDDSITQTCWWDAVRSGYCAGGNCMQRGTVPSTPHVEMSMPPTSSYTDSMTGGAATLQTFIQQQVAAGAFPPPDANTVYVLYPPASTTITLDGATSCQTFGGYHNSTTVTPPNAGATHVAYAVIPRCQNAIDYMTIAASKEIVEAATDPNVGENQVGFSLPSSNLDDLPWSLVFGGGEAADLCVDLSGLNQDQTAAGGYTVQRIWSNANAAASLDPCVPTPPGETYFNLAPPAGMGTIQLAVGATATYTATAFSTAPMNSWPIVAEDIAQLQQQQPYLTINMTIGGAPASTAKNGDQITVSVTLTKQPPQLPGANFSGMPYMLISAVSQNGPIHYWPGLVVAQ